MTVQITVRLPDDLVAFVDEQVQHGTASSRAALVALALHRIRRAMHTERDVEIYRQRRSVVDDDLDGLTRYATTRAMDID